ncbi:MAG: hypothetical protein WBF04_00900 [Candidatus Sulfotelmatobacter sp.]
MGSLIGQVLQVTASERKVLLGLARQRGCRPLSIRRLQE